MLNLQGWNHALFAEVQMHFALSKKTANMLCVVTIRKAAAVQLLDIGKVSKKQKQYGILAPTVQSLAQR